MRVLAASLLAAVATGCGSPAEAPVAPTGPDFRAADGWTTATTGATEPPQAAAALAATVGLMDEPGTMPHRTLERLGPDDVLIDVLVYGRGGPLDYPDRRLPLSLAGAEPEYEWEGGSGLRYRVLGRVDGWNVEAAVYFGTGSPDERTRRRAEEQLARLILPQSGS